MPELAGAVFRGSSNRALELGSMGGRPQDGKKTIPGGFTMAPRWSKTPPRRPPEAQKH